MKVKLLKAARIKHEAGDIVEVSPADARYLIMMKVAEKVAEEAPKRKKRSNA